MTMAKPCKRCKPSECEECPEWIFTFADLVMLMMGFFVILWVLKPSETKPSTPQGQSSAAMQTDDWLQTVGEIRGAFGWEPDPNSSDPVDQVALRKRARNGPGEKGRAERSTQGALGTDPEVTAIRPSKQASVGGRLEFERGDAHLREERIDIARDEQCNFHDRTASTNGEGSASRRSGGPGRAPGERLCRQRGRLTPRTPALRPSHSRT